MDINWKCDGCGQGLVTDDKYAGAEVECPKCEKSLVIPSSQLLHREKKLAEPNKIEGSKETTLTMSAMLGARYGTANECVAECIKCHQPIMFLLPDRPIRGKLPQLVYKHECNHCGQALYAVTRTNGMPVLATYCCVVDGQLRIDNLVKLEIDDAGGVTFRGPRLDATPLVAGRGRDGKLALLTHEESIEAVRLRRQGGLGLGST